MQGVKEQNPFLESQNSPLLAAKRCKGWINYSLQNYRAEILMFILKNTRGINIYERKCK